MFPKLLTSNRNDPTIIEHISCMCCPPYRNQINKDGPFSLPYKDQNRESATVVVSNGTTYPWWHKHWKQRRKDKKTEVWTYSLSNSLVQILCKMSIWDLGLSPRVDKCPHHAVTQLISGKAVPIHKRATHPLVLVILDVLIQQLSKAEGVCSSPGLVIHKFDMGACRGTVSASSYIDQSRLENENERKEWQGEKRHLRTLEANTPDLLSWHAPDVTIVHRCSDKSGKAFAILDYDDGIFPFMTMSGTNACNVLQADIFLKVVLIPAQIR